MLDVPTDPGVRVAKKSRGSVAPYVALVLAVIIFVPALRDAVLGWVPPLLDALKGLNPFRS
jgi:hypothetical protein